MSSAIFLYFSDYNKLKLIYTLASPAKASQLGEASWTVELQDCLPSPSLPWLSKPNKGTVQRNTPSSGCQHDPSAASKEKGKKPESIPALQLEGRAHWHSQYCQLPLQWDTHILGHFFPLKAPIVLGEMRLTAFGIRKESTTQSSADSQERPSLNSEVFPHRLRHP